jgi:hypothetical protein
MKRPVHIVCLSGWILCGLALSARSQVLVNDSWRDGTRTDPAPTTYSEFGTDSDSDGDIESAWIAANRATNFIAAVGSLTFKPESGTSRAGLTYFTPSASPVTLSDGQALKISLTFTPSGVAANSTASTTRFAVADYTGGTRLTADGTSSSMNGTGVKGYGLFLNVANTFGAVPLSLRERTTLGSDLLGQATDWTTLSSGGGLAGDPGLFDGVSYTLTITLARISSTQLDITAAITGNNLNISHTATDTSPSTFTFDAFALRASNNTDTPTMQFTNFKVELIAIPEPATGGLLAFAGIALLAGKRLLRRRS